MHLHDATDQAAVDLFLRTLKFPFPARDLVGIPGNFIGIPTPYHEDKAALLVHELEHVTQLTYPLGTFFTALGVRAHDLRNEATGRLNAFQERFATYGKQSKAGAAPDIDRVSDELEARKVVTQAAEAAEFATLAVTTMELMMPLLEGLATVSEMEIDRHAISWSWFTAIMLDGIYHKHKQRLESRDMQPPFTERNELRKQADTLSWTLAIMLHSKPHQSASP